MQTLKIVFLLSALMLFNGDFRCVLQHQQLSPSSLICFRQERCWSNRCFVWFCWFTFLWTFSNHARRDTSYTNISLSLYRKTFGGVAWEIVSLFGNMWFFVDGSPSVSFFTWQLTHVLIFLDILYGSHILSSKSQIKIKITEYTLVIGVIGHCRS
jgi:hypothetical protein